MSCQRVASGKGFIILNERDTVVLAHTSRCYIVVIRILHHCLACLFLTEVTPIEAQALHLSSASRRTCGCTTIRVRLYLHLALQVATTVLPARLHCQTGGRFCHVTAQAPLHSAALNSELTDDLHYWHKFAMQGQVPTVCITALQASCHPTEAVLLSKASNACPVASAAVCPVPCCSALKWESPRTCVQDPVSLEAEFGLLLVMPSMNTTRGLTQKHDGGMLYGFRPLHACSVRLQHDVQVGEKMVQCSISLGQPEHTKLILWEHCSLFVHCVSVQ